MIVDVRTYNIVRRKMGEYLKLFETRALPVMRRHIGDPLGYFVVEHGPLHQVVHLWGYTDLADLERRRAARDADPDWADFWAIKWGDLLRPNTRHVGVKPVMLIDRWMRRKFRAGAPYDEFVRELLTATGLFGQAIGACQDHGVSTKTASISSRSSMLR